MRIEMMMIGGSGCFFQGLLGTSLKINIHSEVHILRAFPFSLNCYIFFPFIY